MKLQNNRIKLQYDITIKKMLEARRMESNLIQKYKIHNRVALNGFVVCSVQINLVHSYLFTFLCFHYIKFTNLVIISLPFKLRYSLRSQATRIHFFFPSFSIQVNFHTEVFMHILSSNSYYAKRRFLCPVYPNWKHKSKQNYGELELQLEK